VLVEEALELPREGLVEDVLGDDDEGPGTRPASQGSCSGGRGEVVPGWRARPRTVVTGPYRWIRDTRAVSRVTQTLGVALLVGSPLHLLVPPAGALPGQVVVRPSEQRFPNRRSGAGYAASRDAVPLRVPRRRPPSAPHARDR